MKKVWIVTMWQDDEEGSEEWTKCNTVCEWCRDEKIKEGEKMKEQTKMTDETNAELTPAHLRKIAEEVNRKKKSLLEKTVYQCVEDNVNAINNSLTMMAKKGYYEMSSPINIYDKKYTTNIDESDTTEFANAVIKNLKSIYVKKGFKVPDMQSNYFKLGW